MLRNRILVGLLFILSLVGISVYGGPITYGFFIMVTLLPITSAVYLLCVRVRFRIYQRLEGKTFVSNHAIPYYFTLQNEAKFAFAGVRVFFYSDYSTVFGLADGAEYELFPETGITRDTMLFCKYRGHYTVGIKSVEITDFLRILRIRYKNREPLEVTVNPDTVVLPSLRSLTSSRAIAVDALHGTSIPDMTVREYRTDDSFRRIHWKASAKAQQLMVRNVTGEEQKGVSVVLSTYRFASDPAVFLPVENRMLEIALALTHFFLLRGTPVHACHRTDAFSENVIDGTPSFDAYYSVLSALPFSDACADGLLFSDIGRQPSVSETKTAFLVLNRWDAEAEQLCRTWNAGGVPVVAYIVSKETPDFAAAASLPRTDCIVIPPDAPLKEVL